MLEIGESTSRSQYTRSKSLLESILIKKRIIERPASGEDLPWLASAQ